MTSTGTITAAQRDEVVQIQDRDFQRWTVAIESDGKTIHADVLRKPESPDPTGLEVELKPNGRWKVGTGSFGSSPVGGTQTFAGDGKQKSITRQGAQQRAALYLIAKALCKQHGVDLDIDEFTRLVGVFERDATGEQA